MTTLADLAELVRAPAALSVPGDVVAGAAAAGALGPAYARPWPARRCCSTGPAWPPTTGPTATLDADERPGAADPQRADHARPPRVGLAAGLTAAGVGLAAAAGRPPRRRRRRAAGRHHLGVRPAGQEHRRRPGRDGRLPGAGRAARRLRRPAGAGVAGGGHRRRAHLDGHRAVPPRGLRRRRRTADAHPRRHRWSPPAPRGRCPTRALDATAGAVPGRHVDGSACRGRSRRRSRRRCPQCSPAGTPPATARPRPGWSGRPAAGRVRAAVGAGITGLPALQGALTARGWSRSARGGRRGGRAAGPPAGPKVSPT